MKREYLLPDHRPPLSVSLISCFYMPFSHSVYCSIIIPVVHCVKCIMWYLSCSVLCVINNNTIV